MKNKRLILAFLTLFVATNIMSQTFPIDTAKLNNSFRELLVKPNSIERQKAFFEAFPNTWTEFIMTYQFMADKNYDLTMYSLAHEQIEALGGRVILFDDSLHCHTIVEALGGKITLIDDSLYCEKIVNVAIGGVWSADAPSYYKNLLHRVMLDKMDEMLYAISKLRKGHQMQFWQFYWSSNVKSKSLEEEFDRFFKLNAATYPEEMKTMKIAFEYFYNGVNISGRYGIYLNN